MKFLCYKREAKLAALEKKFFENLFVGNNFLFIFKHIRYIYRIDK